VTLRGILKTTILVESLESVIAEEGTDRALFRLRNSQQTPPLANSPSMLAARPKYQSVAFLLFQATPQLAIQLIQ
jgi:hypothetical protein